MVASVDDFLNTAASRTVPLFEHLEFEFLLEYDVFTPAPQGRIRIYQPSSLFRAFSTTTTRTSTALVQLHEIFSTVSSGITAASVVDCQI